MYIQPLEKKELVSNLRGRGVLWRKEWKWGCELGTTSFLSGGTITRYNNVPQRHNRKTAAGPALRIEEGVALRALRSGKRRWTLCFPGCNAPSPAPSPAYQSTESGVVTIDGYGSSSKLKKKWPLDCMGWIGLMHWFMEWGGIDQKAKPQIKRSQVNQHPLVRPWRMDGW